MNQSIFQRLNNYLSNLMLRQCENLSDDILEKMLQVDKYEINKLVDTLHNEHVLRYKWTFKCPHCNNLNTVFEDDKEENTCQFCSQGIDVCELKRGARIQYMVDRSDFEEYLKERDDTYSDSGGKKTNSYKVVPMKNPIVQNDRSCDGGPHNMEEQQKELDGKWLQEGVQRMMVMLESDSRNESFARVCVASFMTRMNPTVAETDLSLIHI